MCPLCGLSSTTGCYLPDTIFNHKRFTYKKCKVCCTIFVFPPPSPEDLCKMYDYESYHSIFYKNTEESQGSFNKSLALLKGYLPQGKLLDVGCGVGSFMTEAARAGFTVWGTELNNDLISVLTSKGLATLSSEDLKDVHYHHFFDVIHMGDVLEHSPSPGIFLHNLLSLLKPNGYFLIEGPLENNNTISLFMLKLYKYIQKNIKKNIVCQHVPYHITMMTYQGFTNFLNKSSLKITKSVIFEHDWPLKIDFSKKQFMSIIKNIVSFISVKVGNSFLGKKMKWGNRILVISKKGGY